MKKLWKCAVRQWSWDGYGIIYPESREECERKARHYPARDDTEYAGNFTDEHAFEKLCESVGQDY